MSEWRVAQALVTFIHQCNVSFPGRSRASDGTIGDARHRAETHSDHNPDRYGAVTAFDLTHDPAHGADIAVVAEQLRKAKDRRTKYVIANRRIFSAYSEGGVAAWTWRPYHGTDPHENHLHLSVSTDPRLYDDPADWHLPCFGEDDDMADVMVPTSDNNPHHKPGTLLPLAQYLQELSHEVFAIREVVQKDIVIDKHDDAQDAKP